MSLPNGNIPRDPSWCIWCNFPESFGYKAGAPCHLHSDKDGKPKPYTSYDYYEPSRWVEGVVGGLYKSVDGFVYLVTGYDPRAGFHCERVGVDEADKRKTNISERAINRTFHPLWRGNEDEEFRAKHGLGPKQDISDPAYRAKHGMKPWEETLKANAGGR